MTIDEAYRFINYVANKEQRGVIKPSDFNLLIRNAQIEFVSKRLGNVKTLNAAALPQFGYKINRKLLEDLRTLLVRSTQVVNSEGYVLYPSDYFYLDSIYKDDFTEIKVVNTDEYPRIKRSQIVPPTNDYPVAVPFNDRVLVDPLSSESFNLNPEFDDGLTNWSQIQSIEQLFQPPALNLWVDSGLSGWEYMTGFPVVPPTLVGVPWATGANPISSIENEMFTSIKQMSNLLVCDYNFTGSVSSIKASIDFILESNTGVFSSHLMLMGFLKDNLFVPFAFIDNYSDQSELPPKSPFTQNKVINIVTQSGNYDFEKLAVAFGISISDAGVESQFTLQSLSLIFENGTPQQWEVSNYGYVSYLATTIPGQSYLLYQAITGGSQDVSVEFGIQYQGTIFVDVHELDIDQNSLSINTVQVISNGSRMNQSIVIPVSSSCTGIGIITRTVDNVGGEVKLYKLSFETPVYCKFNYIKYPQTPYWAYTEDSDGNPVYDSLNSVQLSTPPHTHVEICMIALQSIGINLDAAQITQYASMRESTMG